MTLTRTLLRIATVKAITGRTLADLAVFDSDIDPIDMRVGEKAGPLIVVYTDEETSEPVNLSDMLQGGHVDLVIEIVYAGRVVVPIDSAGPGGPVEATRIELAQTDATNEIGLDLIEGQIIRTLTGGQGEWSAIWRRLVTGISRRRSKRGASTEQGNRFAVRQIVLTCEPLIDPVPGAPLEAGTTWKAAIDLLAADPDTASIAAILREYAEGETIASWRRIAAQLGIGLDAVGSIGIGPIDGDEMVVLDEIIVGEDTITAEGAP